jgi:sulfate permease, SulP family
MPYSVISGFMSGIGIMLILLQLYPLFGVPSPPGGGLGAFTAIPQLVANVRWWDFSLGAVALLVLFGMPASWRQRFPPHLIALAVGTVISVTLLGGVELRRVGEIPMGLPEVAFPRFSTAQLSLILIEGMVLGLLGSIDTLLTAMISDSLTRREHDSNRELVGQGIANMTTSFFGGLPGAGATMGTVVNIQVGARSPVAAIVRALILVLIILAFAPLLESVPLAVLAAIAVKVGYDILDWSFIKRAHAVYMPAAVIMYGVMAMTVFVDLIAAVALGVFVANLLMIERLAEIQSKKVSLLDTSDMGLPLPEEERALFERGRGRIVLLHLSGPMIFGVAKAISQQHRALEDARVFILDLTDVPLVSATVALALENVVREAREAGLEVFVCTSAPDVRGMLQRLQDIGREGVSLCDSRLEALQRAMGEL